MTIQDVINCTGIFDKFNCLIFSRNDLSAKYILRGLCVEYSISVYFHWEEGEGEAMSRRRRRRIRNP